MRATIRMIAILLVLSFGALVISCSEKGASTFEHEQASAQTTDNSGSLGGAFSFSEEVRVLAAVTDFPEYGASDERYIAVSGALYLRNEAIAERLGVTLRFDLMPLLSENDREEYLWHLRSDTLAGPAESYALIAADAMTIVTAASRGLCTDLLEEAPSSADGLSDALLSDLLINDRLYGTPSLGAPSFTGSLYVTLTSVELLSECGLSERALLAEALGGGFTMERMLLCTESLYSDLNGNDAVDERDRFGLLVSKTEMSALFLGVGGRMIDTDKGRIRISDQFCTPEAETAMKTLLYRLEVGDKDYLMLDDEPLTEYCSLFRLVPCSAAIQAAMDATPDGSSILLPLPKASALQASYVIPVGHNVVLYAIPVGCKTALETAAMVLTTLALEGEAIVTAALYEAFYGEAYGENGLRTEVFDLIRASARFDYGFGAAALLRGEPLVAVGDYVSRYGLRSLSLYREALGEALDDELDTLNEAFFDILSSGG